MLILVGNKIDVDDSVATKCKRQVPFEEGEKFKERHKLNYFTEVSAKTGAGIQEMVEYIARNLYKVHKDTVQMSAD